MNSSAYGLTSRMLVEQNQRLQTITDNLANSATPGYRRDRVSSKAFDQLLMEKAGPPQVSVDLSDGSLRNTGNPLDFAISGKGFFVLESDNGRQYLTRNGQFLLSGDGNLVTPAGLTVQSESGSINLPSDADMTKFSVDPDGSIRLDGRTMGKLLIVEAGRNALLKRAGPSLLTVPNKDAVQAPDAGSFKVMNRALEGSNTVVFEEMAEMMTGFRSFDMSQKIMRTQSGMESEMIKSYGV